MSEPPVRERLIAAAVDLLAAEGPEAVQARKLTAEVGTSTMAVYTHFGGMPGLVDAVAREGFVRLGRALAAVERTDSPLADLMALGLAYRDQARAHPELYRVMFGVTAINGHRPVRSHVTTTGAAATDAGTGVPTADEATGAATGEDRDEALATFNVLVGAVEAAMAGGALRPADPTAFAAQLWSLVHGYVLLETAGYFDDDGLERVLLPLMTAVAVGAGPHGHQESCPAAGGR
ncbi:TetR/AcrR family transcriptional regulator [Streptomyces sp. B1866]|uniref:TetR/AcrR family transcriptional regulator n=1 Tax=Streptomyces sp. B1866 TaxID=3075431 RepID=UPI00288F457A|nr:TetR/AcrR family transcriptional regulator [Streptomyces sp. B1866]MDT3396865.1 TetR/AcrR family transcriptional regulator [Streptomyces sp. B1866]